ncbi:fatty acid desaturase family protein [Undibacterium sp. SXout20W]|uniref:fatty acid desaturase family protein n=1 Tax=Undibacterium sp. SXout20W TaxID=3413051 RepID=UPI003BF01828
MNMPYDKTILEASQREAYASETNHRAIIREMAKFVKTNNALGASLFLIDITLYGLAIVAVLLVQNLPLKILASIFAGIKLSNLAALAHDAAHNSLTNSRRLNWLIGVLSFTTCLFNYRLWVYDHHSLHHPHTNDKHPDSYKPLSKAEYDALTTIGKYWYRFIRSANPFAFGTYYIVQRWSRVKFIPGAFLPAKLRTSAWQHFAFMMVYLVSFITLLAMAPQYSSTSVITAILLGLVLPFFIFQSLLALALYLNHTHPAIPWFNDKTAYLNTAAPEYMTVHVRFPQIISTLAHHFFEHPAHHVYPAIPCHQLRNAQTRLNQMLGENAVIVNFSLSNLVAIMRVCKLYDYENFRWLDFDGKAITPTCKLVSQLHPQINFAKEHVWN